MLLNMIYLPCILIDGICRVAYNNMAMVRFVLFS